MSGELFDTIPEARPSGWCWVSGWGHPADRPGRPSKLGRWFELYNGGELVARIVHCGHPTALRPWYITRGTIARELAGRSWARVPEAQAEALALGLGLM